MKKKPVRVEPEADDELTAAVDWYEAQRAGLGSELWAAIRRTLEQVQEMPESFALVPGAPEDLQARAAFVRKFPYKIIYFDLPEVVHVSKRFELQVFLGLILGGLRSQVCSLS